MSKIAEILQQAEEKKKSFLEAEEKKKKETYEDNLNYLNNCKNFFSTFEEIMKSKLEGTNIVLIPVSIKNSSLDSQPDSFSVSCIWQLDLKDFDSVSIRGECHYDFEKKEKIFHFSDSFFNRKSFTSKNFSEFEIKELIVDKVAETLVKNLSIEEFAEELLAYFIKNTTDNYIKNLNI
jgi:hypothetical protein